MKRETFVAILSAMLAAADEELLNEAEQQLTARRRSLRAARVDKYEIGQQVRYKTALGNETIGTVGKLNKYSLTIRQPHPTQGYTAIVVPVERVLSPGKHEQPF